jgi:hypothetical protein
MKIIKEIPSLVTSLQSSRVLQKTQERRKNGEFKSEVEYEAELRRQLISTATSEGEPSFALVKLKSGPAYSDYINQAMELIQGDLEIAFSELNYMFSKIASHQSFFTKTTTEIESLVNKLERKIEAIEIEAGLDTAYNRVEYNSFLDRSNTLSLQHPLSREVYYDLSTRKRIKQEELANIETRTGVLTLPAFSDLEVDISSVSVISTLTTVSDFDVQLPGGTIDNILSDNPSDIWSYNILTRKKLKEAATLAIEVDLGDKKEINKMMISPNSAVPAYIESISYINENEESIDMGVDSVVLSEDRVFSFPTVIAKKIKITLRQDHSKVIPLDENATEVTIEDLQRDPTLPINISTISGNIDTQINDPNVQNILGLGQNRIENHILLNNYGFSLQSVSVGKTDFKSKGVYASKPMSFTSPSLISLEQQNRIETVQDVETGLDMPAASIEFFLLKKDYSSEAVLLRTSRINILPLGAAGVSDEYLDFSTNKIQQLRFLGHKEDGDATSVSIYRNGEELILGVDWRFPDRTNELDYASSSLGVQTTRTLVEIMHAADQITNGIYYAAYTPRYILEPDKEVTDSGTKYLESGATSHPIDFFGEEIKRSDLFIKATLRNHTDSGVSSPLLDYYRVLVKEEIDEQ